MGEDTPPVAASTGQEIPSNNRPAGAAGHSTADIAKDQAGQVADTAKEAGSQVAGAVQDQAGELTAEAGRQAKQLLSQAQSEVSEQAAATQQRAAEGLHSLAAELAGMAQSSDQDGLATDLARQAADRAHQAAGWLADRDPGALLEEVRSFARRKPGTYLAIALGAGVLAGRLTRGLTAPADDDPTDDNRGIAGSSTGTPAAPNELLGAGQGRLNGSAPVRSPLGSVPPALGAALPEVPVPVVGSGTNGVLGTPRGDVAP